MLDENIALPAPSASRPLSMNHKTHDWGRPFLPPANATSLIVLYGWHLVSYLLLYCQRSAGFDFFTTFEVISSPIILSHCFASCLLTNVKFEPRPGEELCLCNINFDVPIQTNNFGAPLTLPAPTFRGGHGPPGPPCHPATAHRKSFAVCKCYLGKHS